MRHKISVNPLGRTASHRKAMHNNMITSLVKHERIITTKAKAMAVKRTVEKMITRAKVDSVHNRRMVGRDIKDKEMLAKLFTEIGPRFSARPGGYTRVLKIGQREGDASEMVVLELVERSTVVIEKTEKKARDRQERKEKREREREAAAAEEAAAAADADVVDEVETAVEDEVEAEPKDE